MGKTHYFDRFDDSKLHELTAVFNRCRNCSYVTANTESCNECPNCHVAQGSNELLHFSFDTHALLQLLSDSFSKHLRDDQFNTQLLATVIFFCSLTEILLYRFLVNLMNQRKIDRTIQARLLSDNLSIKLRVEKLFPALAGHSWKDAVKLISTKSKVYDYSDTVDFYVKSAAPARNKFLHEGDKWAISEDLAKKCIFYGKRIVCFFVELHNYYVAKNV